VLSAIAQVLLSLLGAFGDILQAIGVRMSPKLQPKKKKQPKPGAGQ
jgi:hypothetical protein